MSQADPNPEAGANKKLLSLQDFLSIGYLQEINRRFLHPLGLALVVAVDSRSGTAEICVLDHRDDPEGVRFPDLKDDHDAIDKAARVDGMIGARRPRREKALGYWIQPVGYVEAAHGNGALEKDAPE